MLEVTESEIPWVLTILFVCGLGDLFFFFSNMDRMKHIKAFIKGHIFA